MSGKHSIASNGLVHRREERQVVIDQVNTLSQVRKKLDEEEVKNLAASITIWGLQERVVIVSYSEKACQGYLAVVNRIFNSSHRIEELVRTPQGRILIMLSGHKRLAAHRLLWDVGCVCCQEKNEGQPVKPGVCFTRHLGSIKRIPAVLYWDLPPMDAINLMQIGNSYVPPSDIDIMNACVIQFKIMRETDPYLTMVEYARSIGRSPGTFSDYLKIMELPPQVLEYLDPDKGFISAGIAREIAFLKDHGERDLLYWAKLAAAKKCKLEEFRKMTRQYLVNSQQTLSEIFAVEAEKVAKRNRIRLTVAHEMLEGINLHEAYFKRILRMLKEKKLSRSEGPFSTKSPVHRYRGQVKFMQEDLLPFMATLLPKKSLAGINRTLAEVDFSLEELEKRLEQKEAAQAAG